MEKASRALPEAGNVRQAQAVCDTHAVAGCVEHANGALRMLLRAARCLCDRHAVAGCVEHANGALRMLLRAARCSGMLFLNKSHLEH